MSKSYSYNVYSLNQILSSTRNQLNLNCKCMLCKFGLPESILSVGLDWNKRLEFIFFSLSSKSHGTKVNKGYPIDEIFQFIEIHFSMLEIKISSSRQSNVGSLSKDQVKFYLNISKQIRESNGLYYWKRKQQNPFIVFQSVGVAPCPQSPTLIDELKFKLDTASTTTAIATATTTTTAIATASTTTTTTIAPCKLESSSSPLSVEPHQQITEVDLLSQEYALYLNGIVRELQDNIFPCYPIPDSFTFNSIDESTLLYLS